MRALHPGRVRHAKIPMHFEMPMQSDGPTIAGGEVAIRATVRLRFQLE
jgi:uncharacterized protein YggE